MFYPAVFEPLEHRRHLTIHNSFNNILLLVPNDECRGRKQKIGGYEEVFKRTPTYLSDRSVPEQWKEAIAGSDFLISYSNFDRNGYQQKGKQR